MNSKHLDASFGINALSTKLSILISAICLIAGLSAAYLMVKSERKQLLFEEFGVLTELSKPFVSRFENLLNEKKRIAIDANTIVTEALYSESALAEKIVPSKLVFGKDGSIRSSSSTNVAGVRSAAFLPQQSYSHEYKRIFSQTEKVWSQIAPILTDETFFNFYFISQDRFIRISPPNWALNVPASHDFRQDVFYEIGTPEFNPNLEATWTPIYYDDIWERWVISLIVPLHYGGEFKGVTGSDIELPKLQAMFPDKVGDAKLFVLNGKGQIIQFEGKTDIINRLSGSMNDSLDTKNQLPDELRNQVEQLLTSQRHELQGEFAIDDSKHIFSIKKFSDFDWYIGVYKTHSEALSAIDEIEVKFFGLFILYAVLVVLLLHQTLSHLVIKRIKALVASSREVARGQFTTAQNLTVNKDEIGLLNFEFGAMAGKLEKTMRDLRQELDEKEQAEQRARRLSKAVEFSGSAIVITDENLNIEYVNPKLLEMTGFEKS
ncbi:MAG: HAMP domain-containing protein, partial [Pseudoalteromonas spongiae]